MTDGSPMAKALERTQEALIYKDSLRAKTVECMSMNKTIAVEIVECKVLVASLVSARAAMVASANAAKADAAKAAKASLAQSQGQLDDEDGLDLQMESLSKQTESECAPVDSRTPQQREAEIQADIHNEAIFITSSAEKLKFELEKRPKDSWVVLVDASNAPRRVQAAYIDMFKDLGPKGVTGRVMCVVGPSLFSAAQCAEQMGQLFSSDRISDTKLVYGDAPSTNAGRKSAPEYIISAELPGTRTTTAAPHVLLTQQFRGNASDVMCLRCDSTCEYMSQRQHSDAAAPADVSPDECENANFEDLMLMDEGGNGDASKKRMWTFARPVAVYSTILRQLGQITGAGTVVLVTGTASPNAILAAHAAFAELHVAAERRMFVLADRVSEHAMHHGRATLLAGLRSQCTPKVSAALAQSQGRCLLQDLQFIQVAQEPSGADLADVAVQDSPLAGLDITVDIRTRPPGFLKSKVPSLGSVGVRREEGSGWGGVGWGGGWAREEGERARPSTHAGRSLCLSAIPRARNHFMQLRTKEASEYSLFTKQDEKNQRVYAGSAFAEDADIGAATAIFFSSKKELMAFLKSEARPNHRRFADRLIKIEDVTYEGVPKTFLGVLVGVAGEVMAPSQGQRANVELVLAPAQGLNPDLVKLVVKTRNKQGLAKGAELLMDYGDAFDVTLPVLASGAKVQMLGPMDQYMTRSPAKKGVSVSEVSAQHTRGTGEDHPSENVEHIEPEAKRQRTELAAGGGAEHTEGLDALLDGDAGGANANPFADMEKFGEGDRLAGRAHRDMFVAICVSEFQNSVVCGVV